MPIHNRLGWVRRELKRRTLLTPLDPVMSLVARSLDFFGPRLLPPQGVEHEIAIGHGLQLQMPPLMPSARRMQAGEYEPEVSELVRSSLRAGMTFVDAGANIGYYTLLAATLVGASGHVYSFEPEATAYKYLESNVRLSGMPQVTTSQKALGDEPGTGRFIPSALEGGFVVHSLAESNGASVDVELESLDHFFASRRWPQVDLIKLDVEGAEFSVLSGMSKLSAKNPRLRMVMEFNLTALRRARRSPDELSELLTTLGFRSGLVIESGRNISLSKPLPKSGLIYNLLMTK